MKKIPQIFILLFFALFSANAQQVSWKTADEILARIKAPEFQNKQFLITDFGAIADGTTDCTEAIKNAISVCSAAGGGKVVVPEGTFLTGAIHLKSNVNLVVTDKATLLFSKDYKKYLPLVITRFESNELMNYSPFIYAYGQENIAVTGNGTLDGNADTTTWWAWKSEDPKRWQEGKPTQKQDRLRLISLSDARTPIHERIFGEGHYLRPNFIQFYNCKNILLEGFTMLRSPMWEINPVLCQNIIVRKINIKSHGPNNDGCDPESCKDVLIENCLFDTGDDCIAIKSGREEDGRRIHVPSENIIIRNCEMKDGHGGVVIGSEISGDCRNVFAENCTMSSPNLDRALRIKSNSRRGGLIENIFMRNCKIGEVAQSVVLVDFFYMEGDAGKYTPVVRNVFVENVTSQKSKYALWLKGYQRSPIENVQIINCKFNGVENGNMLSDYKNLVTKDFLINGIPFKAEK